MQTTLQGNLIIKFERNPHNYVIYITKQFYNEICKINWDRMYTTKYTQSNLYDAIPYYNLHDLICAKQNLHSKINGTRLSLCNPYSKIHKTKQYNEISIAKSA